LIQINASEVSDGHLPLRLMVFRMAVSLLEDVSVTYSTLMVHLRLGRPDRCSFVSH